LENELRNALDKVRADDALKRKTADFLRAEISKRERGGLRFRPQLAAVCAAFILFLVAGGFSVYSIPTVHIDFDVNPSVGFAVNRLGFVIDTAAYNDDGSEILKTINVKNKTYKDAVQILMNAFISEGYLSDNGIVSVTVQVGGDRDYESNLLDTLAGVVTSSLSDHHISAETDLFPVDVEVMNAAHGHHLTPAKYLAIMELQEVAPTATFEECAEHSIGEIRELINAHGERHHGGAGSENSAGQYGGDIQPETHPHKVWHR
jgi:hypothetical protein